MAHKKSSTQKLAHRPYVKPSAKYGIGPDHKSRGGTIATVRGKKAHIDLTDKYIKSVWDTKTADDLIIARGAGTINTVDGAPNYIEPITVGLLTLGVSAIGAGLSWWDRKKAREKAEKDQATTAESLKPMAEQGMLATQEAGREMMGEGGFFDQQLQQQMGKFGVQREQLGLQKEKFGIQQQGIQQGGVSARSQAAFGAQQAQAQAGASGIASSGMQQATQSRGMQGAYAQGQQRQAGYQNVALGLEGVALGEKDIGFGEAGAQTASGMARSKYAQGMNQQLGRMMGDYISATGEGLPDDMMKLWEEYTSENQTYG